jgi:hypothetical protein
MARQFAGPGIVFVIGLAFQISGIENLYLSYALFALALLWAGYAVRDMISEGQLKLDISRSSDETMVLLYPQATQGVQIISRIHFVINNNGAMARIRDATLEWQGGVPWKRFRMNVPIVNLNGESDPDVNIVLPDKDRTLEQYAHFEAYTSPVPKLPKKSNLLLHLTVLGAPSMALKVATFEVEDWRPLEMTIRDVSPKWKLGK